MEPDLPPPCDSGMPDTARELVATDTTRRVALLHKLGILDSEPETSFDGLTRAAALVTGCPISVVSLLDAERQWFKSHHGIGASETPIAMAFCAHAVCGPDLLEVHDALDDQRFNTNPLVTGEPHIRFYAGRPLELDGVRLGTLCVVDMQPRELSAAARLALEGLADAATELLRSRQARIALVDQQRLLVDIALASGDALWATDGNRLVVWSPAQSDPDGPQNAVVEGVRLPDGGLHDARGMPLRPAENFHEKLRTAAASVQAILCETSPAGLVYNAYSAWQRFDAAGVPIGYCGTVRDVTAAVADERRRYADELALQMQDEAGRLRTRLRGELLSRVSHELRTPLNAVLGLSEVMLYTPDRSIDFATQIHAAGTQLLGLVEDMLELGADGSERVLLAVKPVATADVLQDCVRLLEPVAALHGVLLHTEIDHDASTIQANRRALTRGLVNLVKNAILSSPPGATVRLMARRKAPHAISIEVVDVGPGIAEDRLPDLFQPFGGSLTDNGGSGGGLGLSVTHELMQRMGACIDVRSTPGVGSTFTLTIAPTVDAWREPSVGGNAA